MINFSCRYVHDTQIAENIVQDVFLKIWSAREELNPSLNIKSYLFTLVKNDSLKNLRSESVKERAADKLQSLIPDNPTPEDALDEKEVTTAIQQAVAALPEKCNIIFCMNRYDHLTYKEIAELQKISIKTVETQMGRALKSLRKRLIHFLSVFPL